MTATILQIPLGIITITASTAQEEKPIVTNISEHRLLRWKRQSEAQLLLHGERVEHCCRRMHGGKVDIVYSQKHSSAHYEGLMKCGSVWHCPVCAVKISIRRRDELKQAIEQHKANGGTVMLATYTVPHTKKDSLAEVMRSLETAMKHMRGGRTAQWIKSEFGVIGTVTVREVTYGENGWHYHIHQLIFFNRPIDSEDYEQAMRERWAKATERENLDINEHGFRLDQTYGHIAAYVTKFGFEPEETWSVADEMTKSYAKQSRSDKGISPFAMLDLSASGMMEFGTLFKEYARWFKGKRQLVWSKGLKKELLYTTVELTDLEIASQPEEENIVLLSLRPAQWNFINNNDLRGELLEIARHGEREMIEDFLWDIGINSVQLPHVA